MTVNELILELSKIHPNERVMLASDEEGNSYHDIGRIEKEHNEQGNVTTIYPK